MKEKSKNFLKKYLDFKKKRTWIISVVFLLIVLFFIFKPSDSVKNTVTDIAKKEDIKQTVLATGQVVSNTDLTLSFNTTGIVKSIKVKVGDKVKAGQVLANIEQGVERATLLSAQGALAGARARYQKILEGASNEEIALSQITLDQTKLTQETLINNAYQNLLNSTPEALPEDGDSDYSAPVISGTYSLGKEGKIYLKMYYSSGGRSFTISGLTEGTGSVDTIIPQPIGNSGLYIKFPSDSDSDISDWVIEIPNKNAPDYLANYNAYQATLSQAKFAIDQRSAELALKKAQARQSDIDLANAEILSAQGQYEAALARYNNTVITAPVDGTITSVDIKVGEQSMAQSSAIILQDVNNMYIEANINEANITNISIGMPIDITYDAFGPDKIFKGTVSSIDPSSTIIGGVVNYKVTAKVDQIPELRSGMTANMTITAKQKPNVIKVPNRAILTSEDGMKTIRLITNKKTKKWKEVPVTLGIEGDGGVVEILSGLNEGDEYVVLIKNK